PPADALLDQNIIAELRDMPPSEGVSMLKELVDLFVEGAAQRLTLITESLTDGPKLAFHAHALKSMSLNLGAKRIVELSAKLEELARAGDIKDAPALVKELQTVFNQTKAHLLPLRNH